ncbi:zinc finger CCHC domain-containing protein 10-like [Artemia franciscana]|uniref:zinc finger CCHC domain-containing protein 10-like n=1 Tax=Artemia franciscana TaxID=6661 RepID=UPI0032DAC0F9
MTQSISHPPEDKAFKQCRHPKKMFDFSLSSQESFSSPEQKNQQEEPSSKLSTSREEIFEGKAGSTPKSQISSKEISTKSTSTSSSETESKSDTDKLKGSKRASPNSTTAQAKKGQLKGQKFPRKQYKNSI